MASASFYDRLSDDQLISAATELSKKFDKAWAVCMASHYRSGRYIDAKIRMDNAYRALGNLCHYVYNSRPWQVCDAVYAAANWERGA